MPVTTRRRAAAPALVAAIVIAALAGCAPAAPAAGGTAAATPTAATASVPASASAPPSSAPSPTVTPVGRVDQVAPSAAPVVTASPVALGRRSDARASVAIAVVDATAVQGVAAVPGELAGPAVRFTVQVTNGTRRAVPLQDLTVTAFGADGAPAPLTSTTTTVPLRGSVAAGAVATGEYVVSVPVAQRSPMTVQVSLSPTARTTATTFDVG